MLKVPYYHQKTGYTCGPASLEMVFAFFKKNIKEQDISKLAKTQPLYGTIHKYMIDVSRRSGFYCFVHENANIHNIKHFIDLSLPVIVHYKEPSSNDGHYSVIIGYDKDNLIMNDPWNGKCFKIKFDDFDKRWHDKQINHKYIRWLLVLSKNKFDLGRQYGPI